MKIRPRNIPKYLWGGANYWRNALQSYLFTPTSLLNILSNYVEDNLNSFDNYYLKYIKQYKPEAWTLNGSPLKLGTDYWKGSGQNDLHHLYDDLHYAATSNYYYTLPGNKKNRTKDIQYYFDHLRGDEVLDFDPQNVLDTTWNAGIKEMFNTQNQKYTYDLNDKNWGGFNENYLLYYNSKGTDAGGQSAIIYDPRTKQWRGTSTHARRPTWYEKKFNELTPEELQHRIHTVNIHHKPVLVYEEQDGTLHVFDESKNGAPVQTIDGGTVGQNPYTGEDVIVTGSIKSKDHPDKKNILGDIFGAFGKLGPNILEDVRLGLNLHNNQRIYDASLKGIRPNLMLTYNTHRQIVGDEATKLAYYRRAAQGQTQAAKPFTSDADRQMAYQYEAKRVGDELRALGDLADNQEIRRTSDESNQHLWANTQRATEVANQNVAQINAANLARQNLLALKYAADNSSWDNFLKGREYRWRLRIAEDQAYQDLILLYLHQRDMLTDSRILNAQTALDDALEATKEAKGYYDYNDPEVKKSQKALSDLLYLKTIELLKKKRANRNLYSIFSAKSGIKITKKKKDDLLYKSTRDVVDHFRKMTKLTDDSYLKSRKKVPKLVSHPKKAPKYQQGGVAPFGVFTPVAMGGETSSTANYDTSSRASRASSDKENEGKDMLDLVKKLFEKVAGEGIPIDVQSVYSDVSDLLNRAHAFGRELSTHEIATIYLRSMLKLNQVKYTTDAFNKAKEHAYSNDALNEIAIDVYGNIAVQDSDGKISYIKPEKVKDSGKVPLTNDLLLQIRATSPYLQFDSYSIQTVNNGIGMNKINEWIKNNIASLDSEEKVIEGYTKHESNLIKKGLELLTEAPAGDYKYTITDKNLRQQAKMALDYLQKSMPDNMRNVLNARAEMFGINPNDILADAIGSRIGSISKMEYDAVKDKEEDLNKLSSNPLLAMQREIGGNPINYSIVTRDSNTKMSVNGTLYSAIPKVKEDMSIDKMLSTSGVDGIITSKYGITFGDQQIDPNNLKDIMYSNTGGAIVTLPCKIVNGIKLVNLDVREAYERAESKALLVSQNKLSLQFIKALGEELKNEHLDSLLDSNGLPNKNMFLQFLVVEGYTTDRINLKKNSLYIEKISSPDSNLESRINRALSTDSKKSDYSIDIDDHWGFLEGSWDDIYRGTVFIPLNNNPNAAINSWGGSSNIELSKEMEELYQISNKSTKFNKNNLFE